MQCEHCKNEITPKMLTEKIADGVLREILMDLYKKIEEKPSQIVINKRDDSWNYPPFPRDGVVYCSSIDLNHC